MHGHSEYGPLFGSCHDLQITSNGNSSIQSSYTKKKGGASVCYTHFRSYTDTLGRGDATFTGAEIFTTEDYEVWAVIAPAPNAM